MGVNSLPKTVTRQRRGCDLNPGQKYRPTKCTTDIGGYTQSVNLFTKNQHSKRILQFGFAKLRGAKINLNANSPTFRAAKLKGFFYSK